MTITLADTDAQADSSSTALTLTLPNTEGNFQVVYLAGRNATMTPSITGDGWSTVVLIEVEISSTQSRRQIAMWWRTVPAIQSAFDVNWSLNSTKAAFALEFNSDTSGGTWSKDNHAATDSGASEVTELASGSAAPTNSEAVTVYGLGARVAQAQLDTQDSYSDSFTGGPGASLQGANGISGFSGYRIASGTNTTTASWTSSAKPVGLIAAFSVAASGATGSLAETQDAQTLSASGTIGLSGSLAETQDAQTLAASGNVAGPVTGSLAETQGAQTLSASGQIGYTGSLSETQDAQTLSASGTVTAPGVNGSLSETQADQTLAASGHITYTGSLAEMQADQTLAASGVVGDVTVGALAETQDNQTLVASGTVTVTVTGSLTETQADQTATASGWAEATGTLAQTQADQTLTATGQIGYSGALAETQESETLAASGTALVTTADPYPIRLTYRVSTRLTYREVQ